MDTQRIHPYENRAVLKEYYAKYLKDVRKVKDSTVKHYFDALSYISRYLKEKNLLKRDIYEVMDLKELAALKEILYKDPDFINLNRLGHQMYSAGLNNYFRFASGEFIEQENVAAREMDIPMSPNALTDTPENPSGTYMAKSKHWKVPPSCAVKPWPLLTTPVNFIRSIKHSWLRVPISPTWKGTISSPWPCRHPLTTVWTYMPTSSAFVPSVIEKSIWELKKIGKIC